ncbi:MAG TPA: response regulator transcription factor [Chryseosolibacter sp.]
MKVLIVEDNRQLAESIHGYLGRESYVCEHGYTYEEALDKLAAFNYDSIILDIMLPDGNGIELLKQIKEKKIQSTILIISAKNALDDKINGLELGADDYLTKPFHLSELHARLKAIQRRKNFDNDQLVNFNEITLNTQTFEAKVNNVALELTKKEFDLLLYFLTNKNRILSRQSIAEHLWGDYVDNLDNFDFVYQHVKNLRKKITQAHGKDYIGTVYGVGYKFNTNLS